MPSPSFTLDAQLRFHDKWLKIDLQVCVRKGRDYMKITAFSDKEDSMISCGLRCATGEKSSLFQLKDDIY